MQKTETYKKIHDKHGFPLASNIEYTVSPPNLKVQESYLQPGDQLYINTVQPQSGYQTAISIIDYTQHADLKLHLIMEDLIAGVVLKESTWSNFSNTTPWKIYNKNFNGLHFYFKYPENMEYFDEDFSSPISFLQLNSNNQKQEMFQIFRYWVEEAIDNNNFVVWYRTNISLNYGDSLTEIQKIQIPKKTVYKVTINHSPSSYTNKYIVASGKVILEITKFDKMPEQDLISVINTLTANCLTQCPK